MENPMTDQVLHLLGRRALRLFTGSVLAAVCAQSLAAPAATNGGAIDQNAANQIGSLVREKSARTGRQRKLNSQLWYALQASRGQALPGLSAVYANATDSIGLDTTGSVKVKIKAVVSDRLLNRIAATGGAVRYASAASQSIDATVPLSAIETLAGDADVRRIAPAPLATTNVGALTSQGYISHKANQVVASGVNGTGVKIGILSDSVESLTALIATGDLPADTTVVSGQAGSGSSEGTAMMEIIHDLAPGAKLFFATAFTSETSFADNIRTLRNTYNCDIIVDDVSYFDEGVFQDGEVAKAVNDVTASGALYFSASANSGNLSSGTSGTWEGDFSPGADSGSPLPPGYTLHLFSPSQAYNVLTVATTFIGTHWSDPLGNSTNDYDLFLLNSTGTTVLCSATTVQNGTGFDPFEYCYRSAGWPVNTRIVIGKKAAAASRALHVDTERGALSIGTSGATFGHNAGLNTVSTAAVYWNSAKTGTKPFVGGAANPTEVFSSDGPRKIFYQPDGTPITAGNFLFTTNGGTTLIKPDIAAADGASAKTPGFLPFFGTSAAAPHAAAVAALIKQAKPTYTNTQIWTALVNTALDIRATGVDRDAGYGIVMAKEAVDYALAH
jgi:hypothetical protein